MVAAPYKVVLSVVVDGQTKSIPLTASDVNAAYWLFPDGSNQNTLGNGAAVIKDIIYTAAGTDTSNVDVYVNGFYTGYRIFNGANLGTVLNRQVQNTPIGVRPGATIRFIQNT